jgi:hypothetical protein
MIGILAALGIQSPFVTTSGTCKKLNETLNDTPVQNDTDGFFGEIKSNASIGVWEENKYIIIASILTGIFLVTHIALLVFVKENNGI